MLYALLIIIWILEIFEDEKRSILKISIPSMSNYDEW